MNNKMKGKQRNNLSKTFYAVTYRMYGIHYIYVYSIYNIPYNKCHIPYTYSLTTFANLEQLCCLIPCHNTAAPPSTPLL